MTERTIFPAFLHGGDYNPDQWLDRPDILEKDVELMKKAHVNCVSLAIFAWSKLEPREGEYQFDWLEEIIDNLYKNGIYTVLATPSGAKPVWMSLKYPEICRVSGETGLRDLPRDRHNHCLTSPVYREKVRQMNSRLARRFGDHPGVILWHISNEYSGDCHCDLCQNAFRGWLKKRYGTIEALNKAWWTGFWSHTYDDFEQIHSPSVNSDRGIHGLNLDWKRFVTDQTVDFMKEEIRAVKEVNDRLPATINMMGWFDGLNYYKFAPHVDIVSWDNYPRWHAESDDVSVAAYAAGAHDIMRSVKQAPWLLMESTPSMTNWQPTSTLKRPGVHMTSSLQAVAHGSDSVQYFQWRKSRGSFEKFHGAVVDHYGESDTRVFRDVAELGERLETLAPMLKTEVRAQVAVVYDVENRWALDDSAGPCRGNMKYDADVNAWHRAFWEQGIPVDMIDMECEDLSKYKVIAAPMLYMFRAGFEKKLRAFVENGGILLGTYHTGIVDESDLCYLGGWPGDCMDLFGVWNEEIDSIPDTIKNGMVFCEGGRRYDVKDLCAIVHAKGAQVLAQYESDFYKGTPALTVNEFGKGKAYYVAARTNADFLADFTAETADAAGVRRALPGAKLPFGVVPMMRTDEEGRAVIFVQNFTAEEKSLDLADTYTVFETEEAVSALTLAPYETVILKK